jgi:hypothetical protein
VLAQAKADLRPATAGAIVGVALSLGAGRFIQNFLFNTAPTDPAAMTAAGNRAASRWNRRCVGPGSPRCSHQSGPRPAGGLARNTK